MRFLLDESVDARLASTLRELGHDVALVASDYRPGMKDLEVLGTARREGRILITNDRDFGELVVRRGLAHSGLILMRLESNTLAAKEAALRSVLQDHSALLSQFLVVTERGVRARRPRLDL